MDSNFTGISPAEDPNNDHLHVFLNFQLRKLLSFFKISCFILVYYNTLFDIPLFEYPLKTGWF